MVLHLALWCVTGLLQMTRRSPKGKNIVPSDQSTPIAKRTWLSSQSSISTAKFAPELTTLKLIMFSNLYPLSNTTFINLKRAQFLCDLIIGVSIDICAHIFQTIRKTATRSAAYGCIPFCNLIIKFILCEGINPPSVGKMMTRPRPISMITL